MQPTVCFAVIAFALERIHVCAYRDFKKRRPTRVAEMYQRLITYFAGMRNLTDPKMDTVKRPQNEDGLALLPRKSHSCKL